MAKRTSKRSSRAASRKSVSRKRVSSSGKKRGSKRSEFATWKSVLADRLRQVVGTATFREIAEATNHNHETVRRFMSTGSPSVAFIVEVSRAYRVSADWLLGLKDKR